jgi:CBS domain-containing protein
MPQPSSSWILEGKEVDHMKLGELMTPDPIAVGPETPLKDVAAVLLEHGISGVPVIGERLEVLGVVSEADIIAKQAGPDPRDRRLIAWLLGGRYVDRQKVAARTAAEAMESPAITVKARATVTEAARLMTENGIKRLPVVDDEGALIGIVTRTDLVRAFTRTDEEIEREIREILLDTLWLDEPGLHLRVERGEVRLAGKMRRRSDAELLARLAGRVPGVVGVHSTLRWAWDDERPAKERPVRIPSGSGWNGS